MPRISIIVFLMPGLLAGCIAFPDLDKVTSPEARNAAYPTLSPIDPIIFAAFQGAEDSAAEAAWLANRAAGLRQRARSLRKPIIDRATRTKMQAALERHYRP